MVKHIIICDRCKKQLGENEKTGHIAIFDSGRIEYYALGCEPEWLYKKRLEDRCRKNN